MPEVTFKGLLFDCGILAASVYILHLSRNNRIPRLRVPTSYFFTFLSLFGMISGSGGDGSDENDDPDYHKRMAEFYRLRPMLEAKLREQARLMYEYEQSRIRSEAIYQMRLESAAIERRIEQLEPIWRARIPREDYRPMLRSRSYDTVLFVYEKPARAASVENRRRRYTASDID